MGTKKEAREDMKTVKELHELFVKKFAKSLPNFSVYQEPKFQEYLGYGASAVYVSEIVVPEMTEKAMKKAGLKGRIIQGMFWVTSEINPNGVTGPKDIGRTYTIHGKFYGEKRVSLRRWESGDFVSFYNYSRDIDHVCSCFNGFVKKQLSQFKSDIANKEYNWKKSYR